MAANDYRDVAVVCPFYRAQRDLTIRCEGVTVRGSITVGFKAKRDKECWMKTKCSSLHGCKYCPIWIGKMEEW